ncbi:putative hemolysin [Fontibacillus phaseoli]|uniref:Putative hemolysin n=1 Tax=Fontibacillus phaseoli TaxID=1416533 RepID=A0A369B886_9BACL|nr:hemolysin family protein [Fontibacillus phaseoli]RCX17739.1 putative hemolysin [Fontibacillus phaseoli]
MGTEILILVILIFVNAFFAASEMALVSLNDNKIKLMAGEGNKKAKLVQTLLEQPGNFLATIQIGITLAGFLASAFAADSFSGRLAESLTKWGVPLDINLLETISTVVITLILSYFTLVLGELVPKRLALQKAETIAFFAAGPLTWLSKLTSPFVRLLNVSTNVIVRLFGVDPNAEDEHVTEEEIRMMVDVGKEKGTIQELEKELINNIFMFDNKTVSDIMTHRTNIAGIPAGASLKETVHIINIEKYTRFPVYEGNIDTIIGVLHVKDLIRFIEHGDRDHFNLRNLIRQPFYALASLRTDQLFQDMQKNKVHLAVVIDEYGGTDGMITIEDLIEEIVGNIYDEHDEPDTILTEVKKIDDNQYWMAGTLPLYEVEEILKVDLSLSEYDTLSGFLIGQLGRIPGANELPVITYQNITFEVQEMVDRRIAGVKVMLENR